MKNLQIEKYDQEEIYCRKLGHHLKFKYCRRENQQLPCSMIKKCWQSRIHVDKFLMNSFTKAEITYLDELPVSKMNSIIAIVKDLQKKSNSV